MWTMTLLPSAGLAFFIQDSWVRLWSMNDCSVGGRREDFILTEAMDPQRSTVMSSATPDSGCTSEGLSPTLD